MYACMRACMYVCLYVCMSEVEGNNQLADPNREIGFGFVSCSCRACVRACVRAKLCGRVRDDASSTLVARTATFPSPSPSPFHFAFSFLLLYAWVLMFFLR